MAITIRFEAAAHPARTACQVLALPLVAGFAAEHGLPEAACFTVASSAASRYPVGARSIWPASLQALSVTSRAESRARLIAT